MQTLGDRLRRARAAAFVGRLAQIEVFEAALRAPEPPFQLLWVCGPGGVGKSTLVRRFADLAETAGRPTVFVECAGLDATSGALEAAVRDALTSVPERAVVVLDGIEALDPLQGWLRSDLLPSVAGDTLVVVAGRHPPQAAWRVDPGWRRAMRVLTLGGFDAREADEYLTRRGVAPPDRAAVVGFTRGHPLALALVTDLAGQAEPARPPDLLLGAVPPDLVATLLARFVDGVYDALQRRALHVLGHARVTTLSVLRAVVGPDAADGCFDWLAGLSFVSAHEDGLVPHELARDVLEHDLRWRDPQAWDEVHGLVHADGTRRLLAPGARPTAAADLLWLHRRSPILAPFPTWTGESLRIEPAREADLPEVLDLVERHEGPQSRAVLQRWWRVQPEALHVVRASATPVHGLLLFPRLTAADGWGSGPGGPAASVQDPVATAAWRLVASLAALRQGEHVRVIRSWMGRDGYDRPTPTNRVCTAFVSRSAVAEPGLAVTVGYAVDPHVWTELYGYADYARAPEGDATVGATRYAAYLHDWRVTSPAAWLDLLDQRLRRSLEPGAAPEDVVAHARRHLDATAGIVLDEAGFAEAVRDAFRAANDPRALGHSPLLRSRALAGRLGPGDVATPSLLREVLVQQVEALRIRPRRQIAARALELTYLAPTRTQEAAAARLSLPFSTFRRQLSVGLAEVSRALWELETGAD